MKKTALFYSIIMFIAILSVCGCTNSNYGGTQPYSNSKSSESVQFYKVGDSANNGLQAVTLNSIKFIQFDSINGWTDSLNQYSPGGQVVMLDITIENLGQDTQNADIRSIITDYNGYSYETGGYSMIYSPYTEGNPEINIFNILRGDKRRGCEGFLVPINATSLKYHYHFSDGKTAVFNLN
jgi:hypothetical protein